MRLGGLKVPLLWNTPKLTTKPSQHAKPLSCGLHVFRRNTVEVERFLSLRTEKSKCAHMASLEKTAVWHVVPQLSQVVRLPVGEVVRERDAH